MSLVFFTDARLVSAVNVMLWLGKKTKKKRKKTKSGHGAAGGPWLEKLHMSDNSIDDSGKEGPNQLNKFLEILCM